MAWLRCLCSSWRCRATELSHIQGFCGSLPPPTASTAVENLYGLQYKLVMDCVFLLSGIARSTAVWPTILRAYAMRCLSCEGLHGQMSVCRLVLVEKCDKLSQLMPSFTHTNSAACWHLPTSANAPACSIRKREVTCCNTDLLCDALAVGLCFGVLCFR